jgi:tripartite-type tricarboxylate transporter receptor subunit TctC
VQENLIADVVGGAEVRYRVQDFNWIGRLALGVDFIVTWHTLGVKTIEHAKKRELPIGATSFASGTAIYPLMLNSRLGTRFNIVTGYKHNQMLLAVERGETAAAFTSLVTLKTAYPSWLTENKVDVLVAFASERAKALPDVPTLVELARNPEEKQIFSIFASAPTIGRSFMTAPRVPAERVATLRAAFDSMVKDSEFIAEVEKTHTEFSPLGGAALQKLVADTRNVPASVLEHARAAVKR